MDITTKNRTELKAYFEDNMIPTEEHFEFVFDGQLNMQEDNIARVAGNPLSIQADSGSAEQNTLDLYADFADTDPQWTLNLNPGSTGLNIKDGSTGLSRLFIDKSSGNIGIGTTTPTAGKFALKQTSNSSSGGYTTENISGSVFLSQWASSSAASIATGNNSLNLITNGFSRLQIQNDGKFKINGQAPIKRRRYTKTGSTTETLNIDTGFTVADWTAIISSFSFLNHDIEETTTDYDFRVTVNPTGPNWIVNLGTELITSTTVDFLVDVVFISNMLAESLPDVAL